MSILETFFIVFLTHVVGGFIGYCSIEEESEVSYMEKHERRIILFFFTHVIVNATLCPQLF